MHRTTIIVNEAPEVAQQPRARTMKFTFAPESRPLDGFTIKRAIHRGGFGEVYYAISDAGREVALKLLQNNTDVELRGVQQCLNLSHPHLVTIFDVRKDKDDDFWIVMEYVPGETLDQVLRKYPQGMPVEQIRKWLSGIVEGVSYLHSRAIVHRDLKPGNIFSDGQTVKVGDIGLSKFITQSRRSAHTQSVGTVYYMAPEVAKGRYGKEVDVYALGIMLFEMLTGEVPFDGESTGEILMKHLSEPPDLNRLPPRLRAVVGKALAKDPALRFQSLKELEQAFGEAVLGKSPLPEPPAANAYAGFATAPRANATAHNHRHKNEDPQARTRRVVTTVALVCLALFLVRRVGVVEALLLGSGAAALAYNWHGIRRWWRNEPEPQRMAAPASPPPPEFVAAPPPPIAPLFRPKPKATLPQLLGNWSASSFLAVPVTAVLTGGLAFLEPSLFTNASGAVGMDAGALALFGIITVLAAWGTMFLQPMTRIVGAKGSGHLRLHGLALGLGLGIAAGLLDNFLLVDQSLQTVHRHEAVVSVIGERPLLIPGVGPTMLGYITFFMTMLTFRNWTGLVDAARGKRFSIWSVVFTVGMAWVVSHIFAFPHEWAMAWAAMIACVVQICSPCLPQSKIPRFVKT